MKLEQIIDALKDPNSYPSEMSHVEIRQTHLSVVALAGDYAYKVKKPVRFGFVDFSTLELRRHFCNEEVRLNRRLAPDVYLGVVPIAQANGALRIEGAGDAVEWAVKMVRLPEEATLKEQLHRGTVGAPFVQRLAQRLAQFHAAARRDAHVDEIGSFTVVAKNARENFEQSSDLVGVTVHENVHQRLQALTERSLERLQNLITRRAQRHAPCDTHGDLRLDHVYYFPENEPPADVAIIDCIEFNERFRFADPIADVAFLVMDLHFHGRRDLSNVLVNAYLAATGDEQGRRLLPFYLAYRAAVRGKVEGLKLGEKEIPQDERDAAMKRARAHWLLALSELEEPNRRPCLVLTAGLPGTGKSTLARSVAAAADFEVIRSDVVRKQLAGASEDQTLPQSFYSAELTAQTYAECSRRAEQLLFEGKRVIVDANFRKDKQRRQFVQTTRQWATPLVIAHCHANPEVIRRRLHGRANDVSDADWKTYLKLAREWEPFSDTTQPFVVSIDADGDPENAQDQLTVKLAELELLGELTPAPEVRARS